MPIQNLAQIASCVDWFEAMLSEAAERKGVKRYGQVTGVRLESLAEHKRHHAAVWHGDPRGDPGLQHRELLDLLQR